MGPNVVVVVYVVGAGSRDSFVGVDGGIVRAGFGNFDR
jgi:hypothetical protein